MRPSEGWGVAEQARARIVRWLMRQGFEAEAAEEACANAIAELYEQAARSGAVTPPPVQWLYRRALWRAEDERRTARRSRRAARDLAALTVPRQPEDVALDRLHAQAIDVEMRRRSSLERIVLHLRSVGGYSEAETARRCGRSVKAVERAYARARAHAATVRVALGGVLVRTRLRRQQVVETLTMCSGVSLVVAVLAVPPVAAPALAMPPSRAAGAAQASRIAAPPATVVAARPAAAPVASRPAAPAQRSSRPPGAQPTPSVQTVASVEVGTPLGTAGAGVTDVHTGRSFTEEILYCIDRGPSLDPRDAGCPG